MIFVISNNNHFFSDHIIAKYKNKILYMTCNFVRYIIKEIRDNYNYSMSEPLKYIKLSSGFIKYMKKLLKLCFERKMTFIIYVSVA